MTKKEKLFFGKLFRMNTDTILQALNYDYANNDEGEFKKDMGVSFEKAEEMLKNILHNLLK